MSGTSLFCNKWTCTCYIVMEHEFGASGVFRVNKSLLWSRDMSIMSLLGIRLGNNLHFLAFCVAIKYHYQFSCRSVCVNTVSYPISTFGSSLLQVSVTARCGMDNTLCSPTRTLYTVPGSRERTRRPHETGRCSQWQ